MRWTLDSSPQKNYTQKHQELNQSSYCKARTLDTFPSWDLLLNVFLPNYYYWLFTSRGLWVWHHLVAKFHRFDYVRGKDSAKSRCCGNTWYKWEGWVGRISSVWINTTTDFSVTFQNFKQFCALKTLAKTFNIFGKLLWEWPTDELMLSYL